MPCSSYMLVMMTVDRFQAICYPLTNQGWLHEHSLKVSYLGIWLGKVGVSNASLSRGLVRSRSWNSFRLGLNLIHILFANASIIRSCKLPNGSSSSFSANWHLPHGHYSCDLGFLFEWVHAAFPEVFAGRKSRGMVLAAWIFSLLLCIPQAHIFRSREERGGLAFNQISLCKYLQSGWSTIVRSETKVLRWKGGETPPQIPINLTQDSWRCTWSF